MSAAVQQGSVRLEGADLRTTLPASTAPTAAAPRLPRPACDLVREVHAGLISAGRGGPRLRTGQDRPGCVAQGEGDDERPRDLGRGGQALGQAKDAAALGFDDEPGEQGDGHGRHSGSAANAQDQRPR
jgi:hypothetical protein